MTTTNPAISQALPAPVRAHRHLRHLGELLNPFRYVRVASKRELVDKLEWVLRMSTALCFLGHGFWGAISKPEWVGLITPMGFSEKVAWTLLPYIGWTDIALGVLIIWKPRSILLWKAFLWTCFTPLLRPLAGMSFFEVPERAGNYGIPLAFLVLATQMGAIKSWWNGFELSTLPESRLSEETIRTVRWILQISLGVLLIGHGGLQAIAHKTMFLRHYHAIGIPATQGFATALGWCEIAAGLLVAVRPSIPLVWLVLAWKIGTEVLHPIAGRPIDIFETIERWGDYGGCIALLLLLYYAARVHAERGRGPATA